MRSMKFKVNENLKNHQEVIYQYGMILRKFLVGNNSKFKIK